ncbi:MAG: hypothetical protein LBR32_01420 [Propionibacteriaceae bacterium]|nr:hypothetical protein [Propionibacteriaceae bacterium]
MAYGLYSAFLALATTTGVWEVWASARTGLSAFAAVCVLAALASAVNDTVSAAWSLAVTVGRGKLGELWAALRSRPGRVVVAAALVGGPLASSCYIVGLQQAGSVAIPITALCPAVGAVLGRLFLRQRLNAVMAAGIAVCVAAGGLAGWSAVSAGGNPALGVGLALVAAVGWGVEGTLGGYSASLIDSQVAISIRQTVSGLANLLVLLPLLCLFDGDATLGWRLAGQAVASFPAMAFFAVSGLAAAVSYAMWYKGNALCGTALGMAGNGTYAFWGPLLCWLVVTVAAGRPGWEPSPGVWLGAAAMAAGIFVIARGTGRGSPDDSAA